LTRTCDVKNDEDNEVDEWEFLKCKGFGTMDNKKGCTHGEYHGYEHKTLQQTKDERKRTYNFGEYNHPKGEGGTNTEGVGKKICHGTVCHEFVITMSEE
jgi:hypothetical protein